MNKLRLCIAGAFAAAALVLLAIVVAVPFMDEPPGGIAGSIATFLIAAEVCAFVAILFVGRELYGKLWAKLQAMRAELREDSQRGSNHE